MQHHPIARLPEEWGEALAHKGERAFRAREVFRWIHHRGALDPAEMTSLPQGLRRSLADDWGKPLLTIERSFRSSDGTRKLLLRLHDGSPIETVLLPGVSGPTSRAAAIEPGVARHEYEDETDDDPGDDTDERASDAAVEPTGAERPVRVTQCISTQVGCAMGCVFCASGVAGLKRHLGPEEIVAQVLLGRALCEPGEELRNVVFMGMGEPLQNYDATARALSLMTHPDGLDLSKRRVTVSTSGLVPEIARLGRDFDGQIGLAISLHATDDATRSALMPINKRYPLAKLRQALVDYPLPKRRRITIEYTLVAGKNDTPAEATRLVALLRGLPVKINLIPMNPIQASTLGPPDLRRVYAFQAVLTSAGFSCFVRKRRGDDVDAACGQLALLGAAPKIRGLSPRKS